MAYPTTLALITALWSGPARTKLDRALVGDRRRHLGARAAALGRAARALRLGLGLPRHPAARRRRPRAGRGARARPRQRDDRAGRQPRRHPLGRCWSRALVLAINFAPVPDKGTVAIGLGRDRRSPRSSPSSSASAAPRTRSTTSTSPAGGSSGSRPCAGIIVFGSLMGAMFIGQQFLQNVLGYSTLEAGARDPAGRGLHGARRAALGQARRGARCALHAADRLRLLPARLPRDAAALEGGHRLLEGRARLRVRRHRASASPARRPRTR